MLMKGFSSGLFNSAIKINRVLVGLGVGAERCARCTSYYWHQLPLNPATGFFLLAQQ